MAFIRQMLEEQLHDVPQAEGGLQRQDPRGDDEFGKRHTASLWSFIEPANRRSLLTDSLRVRRSPSFYRTEHREPAASAASAERVRVGQATFTEKNI
jgi:hypothetical protein